jgi:hypothetical protein
MSLERVDHLCVFHRLVYQRACETFPPQEGTCSDANGSFLLSIFEISPDVDPRSIRRAIDLAQSWCELGKILPQTVMNRIVHAAFANSNFVSSLFTFSSFYEQDKGWIFHAISSLIKHDFELFKQSIHQGFRVWEFLLSEIAEDFEDKWEYLDAPFEEMGLSFLIESILFSWPMFETSELTLSAVALSFATFCANQKGRVSDRLLSYLATLFPYEVVAVMKGQIDRLNAECLVFLVESGLDNEAAFTGNNGVIAMKLLPSMKERALAFVEGKEVPEAEVIQAMVQHLDSNSQLVVDGVEVE